MTKVLSYLFAAAGLAALLCWAVLFFGARIYQHKKMDEFTRSAQLRPMAAPKKSAPDKTDTPTYPSEGSGVAILKIPRLGVSALVIEGADKRELALGPGHIPGTALPGGGGNIGIAAHRDTFFRPLRFIRPGDTVTLTSPERELRYKVAFTKIVRPENVEVLSPTPREALTLVTCFPFYYVGAAPERFIVRAYCENCSER